MTIKSGQIVGMSSKNSSRFASGTVVGLSKVETIHSETQKQVKNEDFLSLIMPKNGKLPTVDSVIRGMGYKDAEDFKKYKEENPRLFEVMGGYKYSPIKDSDKLRREIGLDTLPTDLESMGTTIQGIYDGWQDEKTMKKTKPSIESMYNRLTLYKDYRKQYGITEGDDEFNELLNAYKTILDGWDDLTMEYGQYKSADKYNQALKDAKSQAEKREKMKTDDLDALKKQLEGMKKEFDYWDKKASSILDDFIPSYEKTTKFLPKNNLKDPLNPYVNPTISQHPLYPEGEMPNNDSPYFSGITLEDAKKQIEEAEAYYNQTEVIQDGIKLRNDARNDENYEKWSQEGLLYPATDVGHTYMNYSFSPSGLGLNITERRTDSPLRQAARAMEKYRNGEVHSYDEGFRNVGEGIYAFMNEDEFKDFAYYLKYDKENNTNQAEKYLEFIEEDLNIRYSQYISEKFKDRTALSKILYGIPVGLDQFSTGIKNSFNFTDDYIPTTYTQYASQGIRKQLYNTGPNLPEWLGGTSLGQAAFDVVSAGANMAPSIAAGALANVVVAGSGTYVTASLMGLSASGNAYQQMLNQGYNKTQSRTYATLVGISEAALSALLSGMIGGKVTEKAVETAIKGIDNGFLRFAVRWGMEGLSEIPEESLQGILEPMFQNFAVGYELNDMSELDWSQIAYEGLLGGVSGLGFGFGHSAINTTIEQSGIKTATLNYGFSQGSVDALIKNGLAMPEGSVAYSQAVKAQAKVNSGKNVSGTALYNLATAIKSEIETKSQSRLDALGMSKRDVKILAPIIAKAVFGENLTVEERSILNNSEVANQVVKELSSEHMNTIWKNTVKNRQTNEPVLKHGENDSTYNADNYTGENTQAIIEAVYGDSLKFGDNGNVLNSSISDANSQLQSNKNNNIINLAGNDFFDTNINTKDIGKTSQVNVLSNKSGESYKTNLNKLEQTAVLNYKSSKSYIINDILRNSEKLSYEDTKFVKNIDSALDKMPTYQGSVYRNISFDWFGGQEAYDAFLSEHKVDDYVTYLAYTSASIKEDGYLVDGRFAVSMVIESGNAKNVDGYGNNFESEVIFPRNAVFVVNNVKYNDKGQPIIYMTEVIENDEGKHGQFYSQERSEIVQSLQKPISRKRKSELQDISDENTTRGLDRKNYLQSVSGTERGLKEFDHEEIEKLKESFEDKVEARLLELGVDKKTAKELSPIVAKAVFGEKLTLEEQSVLNNSEAARQVVKELSADPVNTIWKDAVKGEALQSTANGEGDSVSAVDAFDDGETTGLASGVVQGADGKQYFNDGSGDEYFGDAEGADAPHLTTASGGASPQGEAIDGRAFDLSEPTQKDIARAPTSQEAFDEAITGKQKTNIQRHIVDICKQLDSGITVEFVDGLKTNGKFVRSQNKILIRSDLSAVQMYVEVFKHEFMHRIETKQLYGKFFDYCFKKSTAFEQYVRAELKSAGVDYNVDTATRVGVIEAYTKYKFDQYKNSKVIPQKDRDAFTMENAREEIIADFFAEVLFQGEQYREKIIEALENADADTLLDIGDEISSENALLELQQKEPTLFEQVVEWIRDIINKLRGMPQAKTLESDLEYLEDMLARVYWSKDSKKALQNKAKESDISYCFARCEDSELISQAEKMEKMGEQPIPIYQELGIVRNVYGEWATEIELDGYRFSPYGNWQSYGLVKKQGYIEGRLRDVVVWPELYEKFPEFEDVKIIIKPSEFEHDTMKFIPDENTGTIFINQKLCDDYIDRTNFDAKVLMVETIQHMIQHKEGNYSEKNYDYWKMLEEKGELPYSKKLGRYLTADDMMKYFADNYDANIAGRRQFMKYIATNLDKKPDSYKNSVLYLPNIDPEEVIVYGKRGKLMSLKEKNTVKKRFNILDKNYNSNTKETESHIFDEKGEATQSLRNLVWQKAQKHGAKFRQMISQIKGGNSGFAEKSDIDARERIKNQIELASKISVADTDTVNRKNNAEIRQNMQGSIAVNEKGQPISLYALSTHGDDLFKNLQVGIKLSTITAMSEMYNSEDMRYKRVKFFECYAVAKKPFYLESEPYELSVGEIGFQMVESGILSRNTYLKWVNAQNQNIANRKMVELLKDLGYDSIAYKNSNYDKGSISLVVFDEGQLIRVSEDGMLIENNGIEDTDYVDYVDQSNERFDSVKENNEKMPRYLDEPNYNLRKVRKQVDSRIKLGDAGYLEQFGANVIETVEYIKDMLRLNIGVELSGYDNADRKFKNKAVKQFDQCAFRDENGDILTFALWNTSNKNISQVAKMGIEFSTVNAAFKKFFAHKESMTQRYNGVFEEFILNCYNPLVVPLDNWNAKKLAEYLLSTGEITQKYYEKLISLKTITSPTYNSNASQILREKIKMMGYDCIVFVKSSGDIGVIPFYDSQVVPISQNGILNSDCDLYVENEYMVENPKDGEVIKPKAMTIRDFSKVKDVILSEPSATKKLMHLTEFLSYASDSILEENQDIKVGSSGVFENLGHNVWKFVSVCKNLLSDTARSVEINQLDIADRFVAENVREYLYDTIFKNSDGRLLSFFYWNKYGENRFKHSSLGYNLTTLTGVHNNYLAERAKHSQLNKGEYEEYYIKASKPYIMPFVSEQLTAKNFAEELYKDGVISGNEYKTICYLSKTYKGDGLNFVFQHLTSALQEAGYDSIVYMSSKDGGTVGVIVFEPSQLIPVSINGKQIENSQLTLTDSQGSVYLSEFVEKEINKNIENLDERAIIKLARAYLRSPEGKKDKRPYLRHRPSYLKNQIEMVYENAKKLLGKVYDPSGVELHWDPTKPRNGQWDMGHIPGQKYEVVHAKYVLGMMTPKEFKTWYSDPRNYRPELPSTNRGHKYE